MSATMTLLGLHNWDSSILDGLDAPEGVDKSTLINNLLRECAELEVLYPQPETLKFFIGEWAKERLPVWTRLAKTLTFEYDPISNYDRKEEWTDEANGNTESLTAGFNSTEANVPEGKTLASSGSTRTGRAYGNIGVTTTQKMIEEERKVSRFDMNDVIIQEFKNTFCLLIY